ncbi:Murein DD-endopeptidase MepM and murein hydrolase activator NlpD, contain LysM domain [Paracoccus tibetensis]|uniref:Murein DD-endopeptidase MepM and murein hydrolase activator NlpD, contain LysM domain n=2 Tax=Paracoccus tibetensis TaxID=336292 RepID=A0A1G5DM06_9RHOB|nr:Murein DD-endopeptidase MepM and murein hydrolase activator NlpD, contain LysM domain [Paracoccus tibetensis]
MTSGRVMAMFGRAEGRDMGSTRRLAAGLAAAALLASCGARGFDPDLRGWLPGNLGTAEAAAEAPARPQPDERGVISFPGSQVVLARSGDTPAAVAARLGLSGDALARHNALPADAALTAGAVLVLPQRVAGAAATTSAPALRDPFAAASPAAAGAGAAPRPAPANPREHVVTAGETAWSVARRYNISVQDLASWNGLPADMGLRVGQRLIVPAAAARVAAATTSAPGQGSATPLPPSAAAPLPDETTRPAASPAPEAPVADLGTTRTAASGSGRFRMPVQGSIIRVYEKGRNDGIDIAAPTGSTVAAAGAGTVAAVTRDTAGVPIVVVRHEGDLMTVYAGLGDVAVSKGDTIGTGDRIGAAGNNGFVHFEVRRGFESLDPETFLN